MAEGADGANSAEVEVVDGGRVDVRRERKRIANEAVFELGDELGFPAETLDLPGAEGEGCDGDKGCDTLLLRFSLPCCFVVSREKRVKGEEGRRGNQT